MFPVGTEMNKLPATNGTFTSKVILKLMGFHVTLIALNAQESFVTYVTMTNRLSPVFCVDMLH